jgi:hypothetical protein
MPNIQGLPSGHEGNFTPIFESLLLGRWARPWLPIAAFRFGPAVPGKSGAVEIAGCCAGIGVSLPKLATGVIPEQPFPTAKALETP